MVSCFWNAFYGNFVYSGRQTIGYIMEIDFFLCKIFCTKTVRLNLKYKLTFADNAMLITMGNGHYHTRHRYFLSIRRSRCRMKSPIYAVQMNIKLYDSKSIIALNLIHFFESLKGKCIKSNNTANKCSYKLYTYSFLFMITSFKILISKKSNHL